VDVHGQRRRNDTHQSTTDPEARLAKKSHGTAAKPSYAGHLLIETNRLVVDAALAQADGYAERATALCLLQRRREQRQTGKRWTVGGDEGYDTGDFVAGCRFLAETPYVTQHTTGRRSAIDDRTTRHPG
jgi:hypothetical protein